MSPPHGRWLPSSRSWRTARAGCECAFHTFISSANRLSPDAVFILCCKQGPLAMLRTALTGAPGSGAASDHSVSWRGVRANANGSIPIAVSTDDRSSVQVADDVVWAISLPATTFLAFTAPGLGEATAVVATVAVLAQSAACGVIAWCGSVLSAMAARGCMARSAGLGPLGTALP
jgi:hypothetical protein